MDVNPYESPRESLHQEGFNWERLSSTGFWVAVPCFAMLVVIPAIAFFCKEYPLIVFVAARGFVLSLAGCLIGGGAAMVGWLGSEIWPRQ